MKGTPPVKSGLSTIRAGVSPNVDRTPLYSGTSVTSDSPPLTPPLNSGLATVGAAKSPDVPKIPESSFPLSFFGSNFPAKSLSESFLEGSTSLSST